MGGVATVAVAMGRVKQAIVGAAQVMGRMVVAMVAGKVAVEARGQERQAEGHRVETMMARGVVAKAAVARAQVVMVREVAAMVRVAVVRAAEAKAVAAATVAMMVAEQEVEQVV